MSDSGEQKLARLQALFTALLKHRLSESLETVEGALGRWRSSEIGPFEAHAELLKHVARSERLAAAIARTDVSSTLHEVPADGHQTGDAARPGRPAAGPVLRDAFDAGLVSAEEFEELIGEKPEDVAVSPELDELEMPELPPKQEFVSELMEEGPVLIHIDPRRDDVSVPSHLASDPRLVLRFGWGLAPAIVDLTVDDDGMSGTLTFGGIPHHCVLPWQAVYAAVSEATQQAMVWPDDVPAEVLAQMTQPVGATVDGMDGRSGRAAGTDAAGEPKPATKDAGSSAKKPRRANHLKLVD